MQNPPFAGNRKLRQALNYAIDRETILRTVNNGIGSPAYGPIPPGLAGYDAKNRRYEYNPQQAKRLLAQAGYPGGSGLEELELYCQVSDPPDRITVALETRPKTPLSAGIARRPWKVPSYVDEGTIGCSRSAHRS